MDWFPLQLWRTKSLEVVRISSETKRTPQEVLGFLTDLWSFASSETEDGILSGICIGNIVSILGADELFWQSVKSAGWLNVNANSITIPNWDHWLSKSAKRRTRDSLRKSVSRSCPQNVRKMSASKADKSALEERREEKSKKTPLPPFPTILNTTEFRTAWNEWTIFRGQLKKKLTTSTVTKQLAKLERFGLRAAIASIEQSIANGWTGLFPPKDLPAEQQGPGRTITREEAAHGTHNFETGIFQFNTRLCKDPDCETCKPKRGEQ